MPNKLSRFLLAAPCVIAFSLSIGLIGARPIDGTLSPKSTAKLDVADTENIPNAPNYTTTLYLPLITKSGNPFWVGRQVKIPYFSSPGSGNQLDDAQWTQAGIFWFGKDEQTLPGRNYADVRVAYSAYALHVRVTIVDYYLWFEDPPNESEDLTKWDSVAIFLDTDFDRSSRPQTDDYTFLEMGRIWVNPEYPTQYRRDARGNGAGWDANWPGDWTDHYGGVWWQDPGWNDNSGSIDFGASASFVIPWATLGRSGPPAEGKLWGLGVALYDRDGASPSDVLPPEYWPETFAPNDPSTWGRLHFGLAHYSPPLATPQGTAQISATSPSDNTVEDAWVGGGGNCIGGHEGGSDTNHGDDPGLFVANQANPADFPCFSKSFLRFSLDAVPPSRVIVSATLTLRHWGNADPSNAKPSWVHLFTIADPWQEMTVTWNNAPLAKENVSATWIYPITDSNHGPIGDPYNWDATLAVAEAYAKGQPLNVAIYSSDTGMHSSKYLSSSESPYPEDRPLLTVMWGSPFAAEGVVALVPVARTREVGP